MNFKFAICNMYIIPTVNYHDSRQLIRDQDDQNQDSKHNVLRLSQRPRHTSNISNSSKARSVKTGQIMCRLIYLMNLS